MCCLCASSMESPVSTALRSSSGSNFTADTSGPSFADQLGTVSPGVPRQVTLSIRPSSFISAFKSKHYVDLHEWLQTVAAGLVIRGKQLVHFSRSNRKNCSAALSVYPSHFSNRQKIHCRIHSNGHDIRLCICSMG